MTVLGSLMLLSANVAVAQVPPYTPVAPLKKVHSLYNATETDQFFTLDGNLAQYYLGSGGWSSTGEVLYLETRPQATTVALYQLYKGAPQREHFYTTNSADVATLVASYGYVSSGILGYIYNEQVPGTVPLHRLTRFDGVTGDLVHRYTVSSSLVTTLTSQGYVNEGITGYVYQGPTPTVAGGHVFGVRCGPTGCGPGSGASYRNYAFGSYRSVSSIGAKPAGARFQVMRFKLWTPDMFANTASPSSTSGDHLVFVPRGTLQVNYSNLLTSSIHGIGLIVTAGDYGCPLYDGAFIEEFWPAPAPPHLPSWGGYNFTALATPNTCGAGRLYNRNWYDVYVSVSDTGLAMYSIRLNGAVVATNSVTYGTATLKDTNGDGILDDPDAAGWFDAAASGWFMTNAQGAGRDYTAYVTDLTVVWQ
ncbi:hypothetical protein D7X74_03480 [Corallococcus sp. CA047B]|uniref:hypothetical protein n=1 Tax=Corallococcus sp. CA047B TaxID=2316729 RepID=UPI000EA07EA9|nr:hypothetical protein [Corallococcus sp. CA047B]RKH20653.1 hypothetical protein D7X74_03480 [Corallococcus sp. CA047B]